MGISTSGSLLVIFFGAFIALGTAYTVAANTTNELSDAYVDELSTQTAISETDIAVDAVYHETEQNLTVRVDNEGSTELGVSNTNLLVDGEFRALSAFGILTVDDRETEIWKPHEQVRIENESAEPERVKVVTETGVSRTAGVEVSDIENGNSQTLDRTGDGNESTIAFDLESTYSDTVSLVSVSIDEVEEADEDPDRLHYADDESLSEVNITLAPDHSEATVIRDGRFDIGETRTHDPVELDPEGEARYHIGEFRDGDGEPVNMLDTTVTVTVTFEDPHGIERTVTFTEGGF